MELNALMVQINALEVLEFYGKKLRIVTCLKIKS